VCRCALRLRNLYVLSIASYVTDHNSRVLTAIYCLILSFPENGGYSYVTIISAVVLLAIHFLIFVLINLDLLLKLGYV